MRILAEKKKVLEIDIDKITPNPSQPRKHFSEKELKELEISIRENGLLQPLSVRRTANGYELIAGERRLRACKMAGLKTVSCIVNECDGRQSAVFSMLENLQRQDLQLFEEAEGLQRLISEWGITQEEAAHRLGKSQSALANKLRLLRLTPEEREIIVKAGLTERHARALLRLPDQKDRLKVLQEVLKKRYNVQQTEELISAVLEGETEPERPKRTIIVKDVRIFMNTIDHAIKTMKLSGIHAIAQRRETDEYIECVVRIPKTEGKVYPCKQKNDRINAAG